MKFLSQSPFLQALGYAIANSLWQVALLWIVIVLLNSLFKLSSQTRYRLALSAQLAGFAWFIVTLQFYFFKCTEAVAEAKAIALNNTGVIYEPELNTAGNRLLSFVMKAEQLLPYLSVAYLFLLLFLSVKWMRSYRYTQHLKLHGLQKAGVEWKMFVKKMSLQLGIKQDVKIYLSGIIKSPLTIGFIKPIILIPIASINHLTVQQLEAIILHELAHIKRADYLVNLLQSIIEITLFFNPFTQLLGNLIKKEREHSCDDWVLQFQYDSSMYAEALLRIAYLQTQPLLAMQAAGHKGGDLLFRVKRMLGNKEHSFNYRQQLTALLLMTGILSSIAWLQPVSNKKVLSSLHPAASVNQATKKLIVVAEPLTAKVDNPLFNPAFFLSKSLKEEVKKATAEAQKSMRTAQIELDNMASELPETAAVAVKDELQKADLSNTLAKAGDDVKLELSNIDLSKPLGDADAKNISALIDTSAINASIKMAMQQKLNIDWKNVKSGITRATLELSKLSKQQVSAAKTLSATKIILDKTLKNISGINLSGILQQAFDETVSPRTAPAPAAPKVNVRFIRKKDSMLKKLESSLQKSTLQRLQQLRDSFLIKEDDVKMADGNAADDAEDEPQYWSFSNPVYKQTQPATYQFTSNYLQPGVSPATETTVSNKSSKDEQVIIIHTSKEGDAKGKSSMKKTIRITSSGDKEKAVNITIEIM